MGCTVEGMSAAEMCAQIKAGEVEIPVLDTYIYTPVFNCIPF